eukprot:3373185-Karenia_brevis.AAC.1
MEQALHTNQRAWHLVRCKVSMLVQVLLEWKRRFSEQSWRAPQQMHLPPFLICCRSSEIPAHG